MRNTFIRTALVFVLVAFGIYACEQPTSNLDQEKQKKEAIPEMNQVIDDHYIVIFADRDSKGKILAPDAESVKKLRSQVLNDSKIDIKSIDNEYNTALKGFSGKLNSSQLERLKNDDRVDYVEPNRYVRLSPPEGSSWWLCFLFGICEEEGEGAQETPYGITRVGGPVDGSGLTAWVIDTGVDLDHDDLTVDVQRSASFVAFEPSADDKNGHGTHIAGTIAALDNEIDVVGVAAGATVVAVKVMNRLGFGTYADVIDGIDYVAANASPDDVANISIGGGTSEALDDAVRNTADAGVLIAIAAGNNSDDANNYSPARVEYTNVWTVSAIDSTDNFASFSNYGNPPIEYAAPGVDVKSLWKNNSVITLSGTSMASPHVAGILLATGGNPNSDGTANNDPDGDPDPIVHN